MEVMSDETGNDDRPHGSRYELPLFICLLCGVGQYAPMFLVVYDLRIPDIVAGIVAVVSQYTFWASVCGLIGFSVSKGDFAAR